jgi:hypothetical protein
MNTTELTSAERDVIAERRRQVEGEGWTAEHDDEHHGGSLADAAACYAAHTALPSRIARTEDYRGGETLVPSIWPSSWSPFWWKPKDRRRDLVRAGALIIAEIERHDRLAEDEK